VPQTKQETEKREDTYGGFLKQTSELSQEGNSNLPTEAETGK
jgi:hypothetical protein